MAKSSGHGGRRKGAGRPRFFPTGKTAYFNTRLAPKTRRRLEAEARRQKKSLSEVAEDLLLLALEEMADVRKSRSLRNLLFLIEMLSREIPMHLAGNPQYSWRSDPYIFAAFRAGVIYVLDRLRPPGEIVTPPQKEDWEEHDDLFPDSPDEWGRIVAWYLLGVRTKISEEKDTNKLGRDDYELMDSYRNLLKPTPKKRG